jgi:hypothetical protein
MKKGCGSARRSSHTATSSLSWRPRRRPCAGAGRRRRRVTATWSRCGWSAWAARAGAGCTGRHGPGASTRRSRSTLSGGWSACDSTTPRARSGWERFTTWTRDRVEVACFRAPLQYGDGELPAQPQWVVHMRLAGGRPLESERYMPPTGSCSRERYRHEAGRLARVEEDSVRRGRGPRDRGQGSDLRRGWPRDGDRCAGAGRAAGRLAERGAAAPCGSAGGSAADRGAAAPPGLHVRGT